MQETSPVVVSTHSSNADTGGISVVFASRNGTLLYPQRSSPIGMLAELLKADTDIVAPSNQGVSAGRKPHPFDFKAATLFKVNNVQHSTCVQATKQSLVGLGFAKDTIETALDPLCEISWQDTVGDAAEDYIDVGNGYIEVVRDTGGKITGLHHLPAADVDIYIEDATYNRHYRIRSTSADGGSIGGKVFARFGEREALLARMSELKPETTSEVIHFRQSTNMSRWYGYPRWLAATASIELMQALHQFTFDFFINRGVPEFILFIKGGKVDKKDWAKIEESVKATIGVGNQHKTLALNLSDPNLDIQVEKLAMEGTGDSTMLRDMSETLSLNIVSAHGVPPLLAGILIPGKLGATNELPNALQAFQALVIGPMQKTFETTLGVTLGNPLFNGGLGLDRKSFELKRVLDEIDLGTMDTVSRMRETVPEAKASGRDLSAGLKKTLETHGPETVMGMILAEALSQIKDASGD